jgi:hypothetical protein
LAENIDRELGSISQRLTNIEQRLDGSDRDMQGLMRSNTDLTIAVAGLTARITSLAESQVGAREHETKIVAALERINDGLGRQGVPGGLTPASVAAVAVPAAGGGGLLGAAIWGKIAALLGLGS